MDGADGREDGIERVLADLEQQAQGLHLRERDEDVAALLPAEQARVELEARLHAAIGRRLAVRARGTGRVEGVVDQVGRGWFSLGVGTRTWLFLTPSVLSLGGLGERALVEEARPVSARLGPGGPLRDLAESRIPCLLVLVDGTRLEGLIARVGADFVDVAVPGATEAVPLGALAAVMAAH